MINLWHKFIDWKRDYFDSPYCKKGGCCGEEGCCSIEKSLLGHDCKYGEYYAREVYYNKMIIDEFHELYEDEEAYCTFDKSGDVVKSPIDLVYDRAYKRVEEKYDKPKPVVITDSSNLDACF